MHANNLRFRMGYLQRAQQVSVVTAILVAVFAVVTAALAPQIAYEYLLKNADPQQQMLVLGYIPTGAYMVALLFFVYALAMNWLRMRQMRLMDQELQLMAYTGEDDCCGQGCVDCETVDSVSELKEAMMASAPAKKTAKKAGK